MTSNANAITASLLRILLIALACPVLAPAQGGDAGDAPSAIQKPAAEQQAPLPPQAGPSLSIEGDRFAPRDTVIVTFSGIAAPAKQDWIGMYTMDAPNEKYGEYYYLKGMASGKVRFRAPVQPGSYQLRMFLNWPSGGYTDVARSSSFTVGGAAARPQQPIPAPAAGGDWIAVVQSGRPFKVVFDVAPQKFDDDGWIGEKDPMGTLKGGETYSVIYDAAKGWSVEGFNESTGAPGNWKYTGFSPEDQQMNLWGRVFAFSRNGEVFDRDYGLVGHLR